jgi:hypothetical protein
MYSIGGCTNIKPFNKFKFIEWFLKIIKSLPSTNSMYEQQFIIVCNKTNANVTPQLILFMNNFFSNKKNKEIEKIKKIILLLVFNKFIVW